jgi:hypothetical protein
MAGRPQESEGSAFELDHLHTDPITAARSRRAHTSRRTRAAWRTPLSSLGVALSALALVVAGGAMLSSASGSPSAASDPLANAVRPIQGAPALGPSTGMRLNGNLVGVAATPSGRGYWVAASDGGVFAFGDAQFEGSAAGRPLAAPVIGIAPTPSGHGYWLVGSDGGVFSFGDAGFHGSIANAGSLISPIVALAPTPSGQGYWLVGSDGGVFSFGDAAFEGSATSFAHGAPITAMAATASGYGYYLLAADGSVFSYGDAHFAGSANDGKHLASAIAIPSNHKGYEIARTDGSVAGLGGAPSLAAPFDLLSGQHPVVTIAARPGGGAWIATTYLAPKSVEAQSPSQDPFLRCTRAHESDSAGGYRAVSPDGVYRGAYQFLRSTWDNVARAAGRPDLVGVDPAAAAPADQDQLALFLFRRSGPAPWGGRCRGLQ